MIDPSSQLPYVQPEPEPEQPWGWVPQDWQVQGGGGESEFRLEEPGRWFPSSGQDQPHTLRLVGSNAHAICVEAR